MTTETTTLPAGAVPVPAAAEPILDPDPEQNRKKLELMRKLGLPMSDHNPPRTLEETMRVLSEQAERNGLTDEILADILREWDDERKAARC